MSLCERIFCLLMSIVNMTSVLSEEMIVSYRRELGSCRHRSSPD